MPMHFWSRSSAVPAEAAHREPREAVVVVAVAPFSLPQPPESIFPDSSERAAVVVGQEPIMEAVVEAFDSSRR